MITPLTDDSSAAPPLALARDALTRFRSCFWSRCDVAPLATRSDVALVVRRLRQNGDQAAWAAAAGIQQCL